MLLQDLIDDQVPAVLARPNLLAILPLGSTEYHGPRGPYGTDTDTAWEIAKRVAEQLDALLLPVLPFGHSPFHAGYPGTIHLEKETLRAVLTDVVASLHRHGVRRLLMILGHWDNDTVAREVQQAAPPGMRIEVIRVFDESVLELPGMAEAFGTEHYHGHGGAVEVSVSLAARPEAKPPSPEEVAAKYGPVSARDFTKLGWQGQPEAATPERGRRAAEVTADAIVRWLQK